MQWFRGIKLSSNSSKDYLLNLSIMIGSPDANVSADHFTYRYTKVIAFALLDPITVNSIYKFTRTKIREKTAVIDVYFPVLSH